MKVDCILSSPAVRADQPFTFVISESNGASAVRTMFINSVEKRKIEQHVLSYIVEGTGSIETQHHPTYAQIMIQDFIRKLFEAASNESSSEVNTRVNIEGIQFLLIGSMNG